MADAPESPEPALVLSGPLTVETVVATKQRMAERLGGPGVAGLEGVEIRAGEVTQLDAAGAQLLYAFLTELARVGGRARWTSASVYLVEAATMLGLADHLGLTGLPAEVTSWQP